uniref:Uncharacterized protein n=1 Tax=Acrobeloides nanus TaxID=290746 RepID=A0A914DBE6_9BILA
MDCSDYCFEYDVDETVLPEIFDDYFDADDNNESYTRGSSEERSISSSIIETARESSQEDQFSEDQYSIDLLLERLSDASMAETGTRFSSQSSSEEAVPRRKPRIQKNWTTIQSFNHEDEYNEWFEDQKLNWVK